MPKDTAIKSTAELRKFLLDQMVGVANGEVGHDEARSICNLSQQVHNTVANEIRMKKLRIDAGDDTALEPIEFK